VLMVHPEEGSSDVTQSRVLAVSDELVISFHQVSLTISADVRGRDDGKLHIVAQDHESFWAIVLCLAQYHLDVLHRRDTLQSHISSLQHQELEMHRSLNVPTPMPFHGLGGVLAHSILVALFVAGIMLVVVYSRKRTSDVRLIA
ncbi:hypothetical protein FOMPIDRAFT_1020935, partial [Fomitopsis schrenkii]